MSKVIEFSKIKQKTRLNGSKLSYELTSHYRELLETQACIMDFLFAETEKALFYYSFRPSDFSLVENSAKEFLAVNMDEFVCGDTSLDLSFAAEINGETYRTFISAMCFDNDMFELNFELMKWDGNEWLAFNGGNWEQGPGADYFSY